MAIGSAHGFYKKQPQLDLQRLEEIRKVVNLPLVLHGGSGLTPEAWKSVIDRGIAKINFATEIKNAFTKRVKAELIKSDEIDLRKTFPPAIDEVTQLVKSKLQICMNR